MSQLLRILTFQQKLSDFTRNKNREVSANCCLSDKWSKEFPVTAINQILFIREFLAQPVYCFFMLNFFNCVLEYVLFHFNHQNFLTMRMRNRWWIDSFMSFHQISMTFSNCYQLGNICQEGKLIREAFPLIVLMLAAGSHHADLLEPDEVANNLFLNLGRIPLEPDHYRKLSIS